MIRKTKKSKTNIINNPKKKLKSHKNQKLNKTKSYKHQIPEI